MSDQSDVKDYCDNLKLEGEFTTQDYGFLIFVTKSDFSIKLLSENCETLFGVSPKKVINTDFFTYIDKRTRKKIINSLKIQYNLPIYWEGSFTANQGKVPVSLTISAIQEYIILEIEFINEKHHINNKLYETVKYAQDNKEISNIKKTLATFLEYSCSISQYDSIMIYQYRLWNATKPHNLLSIMMGMDITLLDFMFFKKSRCTGTTARKLINEKSIFFLGKFPAIFWGL